LEYFLIILIAVVNLEIQDNKSMAVELNDLRLQLERLAYDNKEINIMLDAMREQNNEQTTELDELRVSHICYFPPRYPGKSDGFWQKSLADFKTTQKSVSEEGKEKKKAEKMAALMGNFESVCLAIVRVSARGRSLTFSRNIGCHFGEGRADPLDFVQAR
jgi:hypothetical protein